MSDLSFELLPEELNFLPLLRKDNAANANIRARDPFYTHPNFRTNFISGSENNFILVGPTKNNVNLSEKECVYLKGKVVEYRLKPIPRCKEEGVRRAKGLPGIGSLSIVFPWKPDTNSRANIGHGPCHYKTGWVGRRGCLNHTSDFVCLFVL